MNFLTLLVIMISYFGQLFCDYNSECPVRRKEKLDGFVVTWAAPNETRPLAFSHLPRTIKEAQDQNWTLLDDGCMNSSIQHKGKRYILGDDVSVLILYDGHGYVAGMQATLPKALADSGGVIDYKNSEFTYNEIIRGQDRYVLTVYFANPDYICGGRSEDGFEAEGTLNQLFFWKRKDNYLIPPLAEDNSTLTTQKWIQGICYETMGEHYYYNTSMNTKCPDVKPYFTIYDCGRLIGFEFVLIGNFSQEPRFEFVPYDLFKTLINPLPECLLDTYKGKAKGVTVFHIFFTKEPKIVTCPK